MATAWERFQQTAMHGNVVLNFTSYPKGELHQYAHAYRGAANTLVEAFRAKRWYSDMDACPIVFLYRHSIELYLKAILLWGGGLVHLQTGESLDLDDLFGTHSFKQLLPSVKRVFEEAGWLEKTEGPPKFSTFVETEKLILAFEEIDPGSFAFRYPVNKKGEGHLPEHFHFNIIALGEETNEMLKMLDGAASGIYEMFQTLASEYHTMM